MGGKNMTARERVRSVKDTVHRRNERRETRARDHLTRMLFPWSLLGVVVAYLCGPALVWLDPALLAIAGICIGIGLVGMFQGATTRNRRLRRFEFLAGAAFSTLGAFAVYFMIFNAYFRIDRWNQQCLALEKDMAKLKPFRSDSAGLFEALRCQPTGAGRIQFSDRPVQRK